LLDTYQIDVLPNLSVANVRTGMCQGV
jgi:hypothetical protein